MLLFGGVFLSLCNVRSAQWLAEAVVPALVLQPFLECLFLYVFLCVVLSVL